MLAVLVASRSQDIVAGGYDVGTESATQSTIATADVCRASCAADVRRITGNSIAYMLLAFKGNSCNANTDRKIES